MTKTKECECCGKEFVPKQHFERAKYCSFKCSSIVTRKNKMLKVLEEKKEEYEEIAKRELPKTQTYSILKYEKDGIWVEKEDMFLYENANIETCEICGKKFIRRRLGEAKKGQRIFCSKDCYYISKQKHVTLECLNCGNNYTDRERNKIYSQFCCDECEQDYYNKIESGEIKLFSHQGKRTCVNCGKEFYDIRNTSVEFCSVFCKREFINKSALKIAVCKECGKEFDTYNNSEFCSTSCGAIYSTKHLKGTTYKTGRIPWNKGLTKETCKTIAKNCEKQSAIMCEGIASGRINVTVQTFSGYVYEFGHYIRSGWEYNFAKVMQHLNREYQYEAYTFKLSNGKTYVPDFYDVKRKIFYEIKGQMRNDAKEKIELFKKDYPNIKLHVIDRPKYIKIYMKYKDVFPLFQLNVCDTSLVGFADESVFDKSNELYSAAKSLMLQESSNGFEFI